MCFLSRHALAVSITVVLVVSPLSARSSDVDSRVLRIIREFEQHLDQIPNGKTCYIVVTSFFDQATEAPDGLSQETEETIIKSLLDRYLGRGTVTLFNWKIEGPLDTVLPDEDGVRFGKNRLMAKMLEDFDRGFLITGTTAKNGETITVNADLIDAGTGQVLRRSVGMPPRRAGEPSPPGRRPPAPAEGSYPSPKADAPRQTSATDTAPGSAEGSTVVAASSGILHIDASPENASVSFDGSDTTRFYQGMSLQPGQYGLRISADGYKEETHSVAIEPGGTHRISASLSPVPDEPKDETEVITGRDFVYRGAVEDRKRHGHGTISYENGDRYSGEWHEDVIHGQGTYHYAEGDRYSGQWDRGKFHGAGTYFFRSGSKYVGEWRDDKKNGTGTYHFRNGDTWVGEWREDKKHGKGTYHHKNGDTWQGYYIDNKRHGKAVFTSADGEAVEEYWENDELVR